MMPKVHHSKFGGICEVLIPKPFQEVPYLPWEDNRSPLWDTSPSSGIQVGKLWPRERPSRVSRSHEEVGGARTGQEGVPSSWVEGNLCVIFLRGAHRQGNRGSEVTYEPWPAGGDRPGWWPSSSARGAVGRGWRSRKPKAWPPRGSRFPGPGRINGL